MERKYKKRISKFLSLVLRHQPELISLKIDENGWANVADLIEKSNVKFKFEDLEEVVMTNDKKRFSFNEDQTKIRANQGHSIKVDVELKSVQPPVFLYHGTVGKFIKSIDKSGLIKGNRLHVHLSEHYETAILVGNRRGKAIVLTVATKAMYEDGYTFYLSENGVWLTDHVPVKFIDFKEYVK